MSVTDTNRPNSPLLVTIYQERNAILSFLPKSSSQAAPLSPPGFCSLWRHGLLTVRSVGLQGCALWGSFCYGAGQTYVTNPPHERQALEDPL